jgi:predicted aspartyl protease
VGVHKLAPEADMFIKAKVNGVITNLLIDTGATVTLISTGFIKDMSNMPTLTPSQRDILTANGESLKVAGKTIIEKGHCSPSVYQQICNNPIHLCLNKHISLWC